MRKYVLLEIGNLTNVVDTRKHGRCFEFTYIEEKIKKPHPKRNGYTDFLIHTSVADLSEPCSCLSIGLLTKPKCLNVFRRLHQQDILNVCSPPYPWERTNRTVRRSGYIKMGQVRRSNGIRVGCSNKTNTSCLPNDYIKLQSIEKLTVLNARVRVG